MHEHWSDVESDFSAIHHITDPAGLDPQRFIDWAVRLGHYRGAVRSALEAVVDRPADVAGGDRDVDSTPVALQADPVLSGLIDYG